MKHVRGYVNGLALDLVGPTTVVPKAAGDGTDVTLGHRNGLSVVERLDGGKQVKVLLDKFGEVGQEPASLSRSSLLPLALKGLAGSLDCNINILLGGFTDGADNLLGTGVDSLEGLLVDALHPLVVDETGCCDPLVSL